MITPLLCYRNSSAVVAFIYTLVALGQSSYKYTNAKNYWLLLYFCATMFFVTTLKYICLKFTDCSLRMYTGMCHFWDSLQLDNWQPTISPSTPCLSKWHIHPEMTNYSLVDMPNKVQLGRQLLLQVKAKTTMPENLGWCMAWKASNWIFWNLWKTFYTCRQIIVDIMIFKYDLTFWVWGGAVLSLNFNARIFGL